MESLLNLKIRKKKKFELKKLIPIIEEVKNIKYYSTIIY